MEVFEQTSNQPDEVREEDEGTGESEQADAHLVTAMPPAQAPVPAVTCCPVLFIQLLHAWLSPFSPL